MRQPFAPWTNVLARTVLLGAVLLPVAVLGILMLLPYTPHVTQQDRFVEQPVPFSHQHHVGGLGIQCAYCHTSAARSRFAGLPPTETCMTCHSQLWTSAPMLAPVRRSLAEGSPLRWRRVHDLPDYVYFDHSIHVARGVECTTCHGDVARMPLMRQAAPLTMGWCLDCHRNPGRYLAGAEATGADATLAEARAVRAPLDHTELIRTARLTECSICHR